MDIAKNFPAAPGKAPRTCPAQPPANIPGVGGKMIPPEKKSRNEKLKSLIGSANHELDQFVNEPRTLVSQASVVRIQMILIDLMELLVEPEEPE